MNMTDIPLEVLDKSWNFRETMVARADGHAGHAPWWYGWAIIHAFMAGYQAGRAEGRLLPTAEEDTVLKPTEHMKEPGQEVPAYTFTNNTGGGFLVTIPASRESPR